MRAEQCTGVMLEVYVFRHSYIAVQIAERDESNGQRNM